MARRTNDRRKRSRIMENLIDPKAPILNFTVACHTKKCDNAEIEIDIATTDAEPVVICGVCAKKISDIKPVAEPKTVTDELPSSNA
jgi:hypothetical protein